MTQDWLVPAVAAALLALAAVGIGMLLRDRSRVRAELSATRAEAREMRARVDALAERMAAPTAGPVAAGRHPEEFVITHVGEPGAPSGEAPEHVGPERIDGRLFADIVLRESVVKAAALTHGVRRALAPETRNRIRFEMRREVRRSRRQRRETLRSIRREMHRRERAVGEAS